MDRPSFAGRQVHNTYLQLACDLGLVGILVIGSIVVWTIKKAVYISKVSYFSGQKLTAILAKGDDRKPDIAILKEQCEMVHNLSRAVLVGIIGTLSSAVFLSVLYYPPIWILICIMSAIICYYKKVEKLASEFLD